jgi:hypothetical protein
MMNVALPSSPASMSGVKKWECARHGTEGFGFAFVCCQLASGAGTGFHLDMEDQDHPPGTLSVVVPFEIHRPTPVRGRGVDLTHG